MFEGAKMFKCFPNDAGISTEKVEETNVFKVEN